MAVLKEQKALELKRQQEEAERLRKEEEEKEEERKREEERLCREQERLSREEELRKEEEKAKAAEQKTVSQPERVEDLVTPVKKDFDSLDSLDDVTRKRRTPAETLPSDTEVHVKASKYEVLEPAESNTVFMPRARAYLVRETDSKLTSRSETDHPHTPSTLKFKGEEELFSSSPKALTFDDDSVPGVPPRSPSYQPADFEPEVLCSSSMYNVKSPQTQTKDKDLDLSSSSLYRDFVMPAERRRLEESRQEEALNTEEVFYSSGRERVEELRGHGPGETVDLHSSASDEGVLTKESSTEELIDKEEPDIKDGHESEE